MKAENRWQSLQKLRQAGTPQVQNVLSHVSQKEKRKYPRKVKLVLSPEGGKWLL